VSPPLSPSEFATVVGSTGVPQASLTAAAIAPGALLGGWWPVLGVAAALLPSVQLVGQGDEFLVERLGVYNRRLQPGLHFTIPLVERVSYRQTVREKVLDVPPQPCITADNAPINADAVIYYQVEDTYKARYKVEALVPALQNLVLTSIRNEVGKLTLDETFCARGEMNTRLLSELNAATSAWGLRVSRVEVRDILPAPTIREALEKQMTAERVKRAEVLESEGRRAAEVNEASGKAEAEVLRAEAAARATVLRAEAEAAATVAAAGAEAKRRELEAGALVSSIARLQEEMGVEAESAAEVLLQRLGIDASAAIGTSPSSKVLFVDPRGPAGGLLAGVTAAAAAAAEGSAE